MNIEKFRNTKVAGLVAGTLSALAIAGCGNETVEPIKVPEGSTDLGKTYAELGRYTHPARSFIVENADVKLVYCGAVQTHNPNEATDETFVFTKKVTPAGENKSQVDCIYDDWAMNEEDIDKNLKVVYINSGS